MGSWVSGTLAHLQTKRETTKMKETLTTAKEGSTGDSRYVLMTIGVSVQPRVT
jgi:hypothetical protein